MPHVDNVIVFDDGSTDETASEATRMSTLVLSEVYRGYVRAMANGISATTADIIITLDADGEHLPEKYPDLGPSN